MGKPIALQVMTAYGGGNSAVYLYINGMLVIYGYDADVDNGTTPSLFGIIPPGSSYMVTFSAGYIYNWSELR